MKGIFWLLGEPHQATPNSALSSLEYFACVLTADLYRQRKKVLLLASDQDHAQRLDEALWQFDASRFVPHNLPGEGPAFGAPVEINWQASQQRRPYWINTNAVVPEFINLKSGIKEWHDFVPADEAGKIAARERYKQLREMGVSLQTQPIPTDIK